MSVDYWEKSVEYQFVLELVHRSDQPNLAAPLGGNAEGAVSDAIVMTDDARCFLNLIESKRKRR